MEESGGVTITGEAAHIHAASTHGPRYNADQDEATRHSIENAIWLCASCATLIDKNRGIDYPAHLLLGWKNDAERKARRNIQTSQNNDQKWSSNISQLRYINIPTLLQMAAARGISIQLDDSTPGGWLHNQQLSLVRTMVSCTSLLELLRIQSVSMENLVGFDDDYSGLIINFDRRFFTKNGPDCETKAPPPSVPADWSKASHLHTRVGSRKIVMVLDPRWFTTTTAFVDFRRGQARFAGIAILKRGHPDDSPLLASPIVLGIPKSSFGELLRTR